MRPVYEMPKAIIPEVKNSFCPGCHHSTITKIMAEVLDEMAIGGDTIMVMPIGCGGMMGQYMNVDICASIHGRAPAIATGLKRIRPDKLVVSYQGDGDLAAIGMAETIHSANRGEHITTIFVNNAIFGMTGGQMAPTTLVGQKSTTTPGGRNPDLAGYPIKVCELIDSLKAPAFIARCAVDSPAHINAAKAAIRKAFEIQMSGKGYSFVEILSACPTNWGMSPLKCLDYIRGPLMENYPLGVIRDVEEG